MEHIYNSIVFKDLAASEENIENIQKVIQQYTELKRNLLNYINRLKYDVMVPLGANAFFNGQIVHSNEYMIAIGCDYFVKTTASGAADYCTRRIDEYSVYLKKYKDQRELLTSRLAFRESEDTVGVREIREEATDVQEEEWKRLHKIRVKEEKERERKKREGEKTDEWYQRRLDELLKQEEEGNELDSQENFVISATADTEETESDKKEKTKLTREEELIAYLDELELKDAEEDKLLMAEEEEDKTAENKSSDNGTDVLRIAKQETEVLHKHDDLSEKKFVKFQTDAPDNSDASDDESAGTDENTIYFEHTSTDSVKSRLPESIDTPCNPAEIYLLHVNRSRRPSLKQTDYVPIEHIDPVVNPIVIGDVVERKEENIESLQETKPRSIFRKRRLLNK